MVPMFTGWTAQPMTAPGGDLSWPRALPPAEPPGPDITCALRSGLAGTIVLTAASPEVSVRKTVYPDGRVAIDASRSGERLLLTTTDLTITVLRGHFTAVLHVNAPGEDDLIRFREPLVASGAVRWLRALVTAVEEMEQGSLAHLGLRLAGALVAQFDGDSGAMPRLSRELRVSWTPRGRRGGLMVAHQAAFRRAVLRAADEMERGLAAYSHWHPARYGCAFAWLAQAEAAWHACVAADATAEGSGAPGGASRSSFSCR